MGERIYEHGYIEKFVRLWNDCDCTRQAAEGMGLSMNQVKSLAQHARNQGHILKSFYSAGDRPVDMRERPLPKNATMFAPGSEFKIEVMRMRFSRDESVFHPGDADPENAWNRVPLNSERFMRQRSTG